MQPSVKVSGAWKNIEEMHVRVSGSWKQIQEAYVRVGGVWKQFYQFFTASASDSTPSGSGSGASPSGFVSSNSTTITPVGGTPPYTYAWAINGSPATSGPFTCNSPSSATTDWGDTVADLDPDSDEVWRCTVTDDDSNVVTVDVTVTLTWSDTT